MLALCSTLAIFSTACRTAEPSTGVRVVLITLDTVRADAFLTSDGTPPLELTRARARNGLVFERHYSATGQTQPSHATMFTGLDPWRHGVTLNSASLAEDQETLAERLKAAGFETAAVVASYPLASRFGFDQGFDIYIEEFVDGTPNTRQGFSPANFVLEHAIRVLDEAKEKKQFLWVHFFDAHSPYGALTEKKGDRMRPPEMRVAITESGADREDVLTRARELYERDIRIMDRHLDALFERLEQESDEMETHILLVADHGENFGETGSLGHGRRLTRWGLHVPLFILSPKVGPGVRSEPVGMIDIPATILDLAGVEQDFGSSKSLLDPTVRRRVVGMRRIIMKPFDEKRLDGSIHRIEGLCFYSVDGDRIYMGSRQGVALEDSDAREPDADRVAQLEKLFARFEEELADPNVGNLDTQAIEQMRALGYAAGGER